MNIPELPIQVVAVSESNPVDNKDINQALNIQVGNIRSELGTFEWSISGLMLDQLFFLIMRLNNTCSPLVINLQIN